jgi:WXXGXW repeat (2 copies)
MIKTPLATLLMATSLAIGTFVSPTPAVAQIDLTVMVAPPPLPVYEQPPIPGPGYLWLPGYWSYGPYGYFWVPGTWMEPPAVGLLWTPGFWGWSSGFYVWNPGYWAPQIGFYGGVNYGFGYPGRGYYGGEWRDNRFWYNREVNNVTNVNITNVYSRTVVNNVTVNRVSYVGGPGGLAAQPTAEEQRVAHEHRIPPTAVQVQHRETAATRPELVASVNHGKPGIAATSRPGAFDSHVVSASHGGPVAVHVQELPKPQAAPPSSKPVANQGADYQRQQAEMQARQQQERDALGQMQERDHAYLSQQNASAHAQAQMEHQHLQQTQFLQQRQANEMQAAHAPAPHPPAPPHAAPPPRSEPPRPK